MKNDTTYLRHILEAIEKIERYLSDSTYESFIENDMQIDAVVRELEIIGEASTKLSTKFQQRHDQVPFSDIIAMRNFLIHEYFGINKKIVWDTCQSDLKDLKRTVLSILAREKE